MAAHFSLSLLKRRKFHAGDEIKENVIRQQMAKRTLQTVLKDGKDVRMYELSRKVL